jgi:hypothetical protein
VIMGIAKMRTVAQRQRRCTKEGRLRVRAHFDSHNF